MNVEIYIVRGVTEPTDTYIHEYISKDSWSLDDPPLHSKYPYLTFWPVSIEKTFSAYEQTANPFIIFPLESIIDTVLHIFGIIDVLKGSLGITSRIFYYQGLVRSKTFRSKIMQMIQMNK